MSKNIVDYISKGMEIYFSVNNNRDILKLPYVPPDIDFSFPLDTGIFENKDGELLTLVGKPGLRKVTIESFFPSKIYRGLGTVSLAPICLDFFNKHRNRIFRFVVVSLHIRLNIECIITDFTYRKKHNGDISYSLSIQEYLDPNKNGGGSA